jgi:hypothetical protein
MTEYVKILPKVVMFWTTDNIFNRLHRMAREDGRSVSDLTHAIVTEWLGELELRQRVDAHDKGE